MFKILVADDESLARETIKLLLKEHKDIVNVYEASDGVQALSIFEKHQPDIVFLDIQMPGKSGIEIASLLPETTSIIFATAYDQYAIAAFDLNAIGYLLKPYDDEQFHKALEKAKQQIENQQSHDFTQVKELIEQLTAEQNKTFKSRLIVKDPGRIRLIDVEQINFISGAGNYAELHLFDENPILHRETLTELEKQLNPKDFVRIHRSTIVRRNSVVELRPNDNGDYSIILKTGDKLTLSRRSKDKLDDLMSDG